jgi:hypothetical protein
MWHIVTAGAKESINTISKGNDEIESVNKKIKSTLHSHKDIIMEHFYHPNKDNSCFND